VRYFIIGDQDTVLGFGLVGVEGIVANTPEEVDAAFRQALEGSDVGIVIITEKSAGMIRDQVDRYIFTEDFPLIVEIPDRTGPDPNRADMRSLVNQAIGINL
jgi:V/A-type H+-transporting ATPase subunit F